MRINGHSFFLWCMVMIEKRHSALNEKPIKQKRIQAENIKGDDKGELDKKCRSYFRAADSTYLFTFF